MIILHYIPSIDTSSGGVGAYMQLLAKDLGKLCELHVVTHKSDDELQLENCTVHYISSKFLPWSGTKREFITLLNEIRPDVFHTNCCWLPLSALTAIWAKAKGYKVVYSPHGMLEPWIMKRHYWTKKVPAILLFQKRGLKAADIIHSTADSEKENLLKLGWNKNISVVVNCVDVDKIDIKKSWKRTRNILFLSRVHVKKGINFLIEAFKKLQELEVFAIKGQELKEGMDLTSAQLNSIENYRIIIAGPGEDSYVEELKTLGRKLGVEDKIEFIGPVFGDKKFDLYRKADLFVLPTHSENFGIVVAEALACGTPVITTKGTPWSELETENCGWWTEIGTEPTTEAMREFLMKSEEELEQMGKNGRKMIEEKYDSKRIAEQFVDMYKAL